MFSVDIIFIVIAILCSIVLFYYLYRYINKRSAKNIVEVDFRKENGKVKGYRKDKNNNWVYDETLYLEDEHYFEDKDHDLD